MKSGDARRRTTREDGAAGIVGRMGVAVGGTGVAVGGIGVAVGGIDVAVGGTAVAEGAMGVVVPERIVAVGWLAVAVGTAVDAEVSVGLAELVAAAVGATALTLAVGLAPERVGVRVGPLVPDELGDGLAPGAAA